MTRGSLLFVALAFFALGSVRINAQASAPARAAQPAATPLQPNDYRLCRPARTGDACYFLDARVDDITGDLGAAGTPLANWGLHLIDVNLAMGNQLDLVEAQSHAYRARR